MTWYSSRMRIELEPIGRVHAARCEADDDYWGGVESCIELADSLDASALAGIEEFSHVEILFSFGGVPAQGGGPAAGASGSAVGRSGRPS